MGFGGLKLATDTFAQKFYKRHPVCVVSEVAAVIVRHW